MRHWATAGSLSQDAQVIQWVKLVIKQEITRQIYLASLAQHPTMFPGLKQRLDLGHLSQTLTDFYHQDHFYWSQKGKIKGAKLYLKFSFPQNLRRYFYFIFAFLQKVINYPKAFDKFCSLDISRLTKWIKVSMCKLKQ